MLKGIPFFIDKNKGGSGTLISELPSSEKDRRQNYNRKKTIVKGQKNKI